MKKSLTYLFLLTCGVLFAQDKPIVYVNFVSHNEPNDKLSQQSQFDDMNTKVLQLAAIIQNKNASWNLQTCDGYAVGALNLQGKNDNVFKTLVTTYGKNIEIDPRYKVSFPRDTNTWNIADTYHILDSLGAKPTTTLGGFVYHSEDQSKAKIDWFNYQDTITGLTYKKSKWKAKLMWGAGSYTPHNNDLNDWGIFKPDAVSYTTTQESFLKHNPDRKLWYMGNGCQPLYALDPTEDEQVIISELRSFINDIQNSRVPLNKFYVYSITINQSGFGTDLFKKIETICDSINSWGSDKIAWKKLSEKFTLFEDWQKSSGLDHSQWLCGQSTTSVSNSVENLEIKIYPNPSNDILSIQFSDLKNHQISIKSVLGENIITVNANAYIQIPINSLSNGIYFLSVDGQFTEKIIKK